MSRNIRTVKREIRILGLDTCRQGRILGAVVRGGQYLDGVIIFSGERETPRLVVESRYYPELRAIMIHDPAQRLDSRTIEKHVRLPVIRVTASKPSRRGYQRVKSKHGSLWVQTRLPGQVSKRVLDVTWTYGKLPEPARIAHLLARANISLAQWEIKNKFARLGGLGAD